MPPPVVTPVVLALFVAGCVQFGVGPLPAEVEDLVDYLERRNLQLTPVEVAYDRAFDNVNPEAHVVTYSVTAIQPPDPRRRPAGALMDVYRFKTDEEVDEGIRGLQQIHARGALYVQGRTVLYVRGEDPDLTLALGRRFGRQLTV